MSELEELVHKSRLAPAVGTLTYILFGPLLWSLQLTMVYGGHTLICTGGMPDAFGRLLVLAVSIALALVLVAFLFAHGAAARMFGLSGDTSGRLTYDRLSRLISYLALIAILWTGATALVVTACVQGR